MLETKVIEEVPNITDAEHLSTFLEARYVIEPYLRSEEAYEEFFQDMYRIIKGCFEKEDCRTYPVNFKFYYDDEKVHTVQFRHFIINLILWQPLVHVSHVKFLDEKYIMDGTKIIVDPEYDLDRWIDDKIIFVLRSFNVREVKINENVARVIDKFHQISIDFSMIMNLSFSYFTFWEMYQKYPRIKEIMECKFEPGMEPREIELKIDRLLGEELEIYKNDPGNPIGIMLKAKTGIKVKQLAEFTIAQGLKPTLDGQIMNVPIENSTLIRGLDRPSYIYVDGSAARKSLILNKTVMGKAGNFGKLVLQLARTLSLSKIEDDCGTQHYVKITVNNKDMLKKINKRYYKMDPEDKLLTLDSKKDKHLIGQTIYMRSPITCKLGDHVCAKCFGRTAGINYDIAEGVCGYESEEITKDLEQFILSSKHLLSTTSEVLEFNDNFYKFFTVSAGEIYPVADDNEEIENIEKYAIYIPPESIMKADEMDSDSSFNTFITGGMFYVTNMETGDMYEIKLGNEGKEIFLTDDAIELRKKSRGYIKFKDLSDDIELFEISILNNELTKPLYDMIALFNSKKDENDPHTINEMAQRMLELLAESGVHGSSLAGEVILNRLIRSIENKYERPDFSQEKIEPYEFISVSKALEVNKSPTLGLSVQYVKRQLMSDELITERDGTSYVDPWMKPKVSNLYEKYGSKGKRERKRPSGQF